ncbi:CocE/NonD family hydrolase [Flavitalea sp.]|nr:CocE/NonD family hydrolase [Flavitalea sp.]
MKKSASLLFFVFTVVVFSFAQDTVSTMTKKVFMIPMRDGVKLFTVVLYPNNHSKAVPFLLNRTPYGADASGTDDSSVNVLKWTPYYGDFARSGYIWVFQDIRGRYRSEGKFEMIRPLYHQADKNKSDESTDTWDTIEWLIKNIANNNGRAGILGISYDGYMALQACVDPHPALRASSPQAPFADMFLGDDFHHNGAFRLSYGFEYSYGMEHAKDSFSSYPFPQYDMFDWFLKLGSLKNVNDKYFNGSVPTWNNFASHPDYDTFWIKRSALININYPQIPILHVGGYYDQEDLNGPQALYEKLEKKDSLNKNYIILGPWSHGYWAAPKVDSLGKISFLDNTVSRFQKIQKQWFDFWLKDIGDGKFEEANCYQTGSNTWQSYDKWPGKTSEIKKLYINSDNSAGFTKPKNSLANVKYVSDPAKPVPYRPQPIEATYGEGSRWNSWHVDDQRFVASRPDVSAFSTEALISDLTVTGKIMAHIFASTTGTDADFVVKLIDVYPDIDTQQIQMSGYQLPVAMEVFRGRFRKSFTTPSPLTPGKPEEFIIDLHSINHVFRRGHKLMVQIQSSWFPVIDRNPQKYVSNIFEAKEADFIKATQTIYCNSQFASYIQLPVIENN